MTKDKYIKVAKFMWVHESGNVILTYKFCKDPPGLDYRTPTFSETVCINKILMKRAHKNIYNNRGIF